MDFLRKAYILVMGPTGAGKSTFIYKATGDKSIVIGEGLESGTQETAEYIAIYNGFEVHLIDTPRFDDNGLDDARILTDVANRINVISKDGVKISGVLYLHDITKAKIGGTGVRNLRLLEELLGSKYWGKCTLVTIKWGETKSPQLEAQREQQLESNENFWKSMRTSDQKADMKRFKNTQRSALKIIDPYLSKGFVPQLTYEMVDPSGPKYALGDTRAGQQVSEYVSQKERRGGKTNETQQARKMLQAPFNEELYEEYRVAKDAMMKKQKWEQGAGWTVRLVTLGGCVAGTVLTAGLAVPVFAAMPLVEVWAHDQKANDQQERRNLNKWYERRLGIERGSLDKPGKDESVVKRWKMDSMLSFGSHKRSSLSDLEGTRRRRLYITRVNLIQMRFECETVVGVGVHHLEFSLISYILLIYLYLITFTFDLPLLI